MDFCRRVTTSKSFWPRRRIIIGNLPRKGIGPVKFTNAKMLSRSSWGVADVIGQLARQIRLDINCRQDLEEELAERLRNWGVEVYDLSVQGTERNLPQVRLRAKVPAGENPLGVLQALVAEVVGGPMQLVENVPVGDANSLIFAIPIKYKLELGVAQTAKGEVSGDCFSISNDSRPSCVVSDGMGKGWAPSREQSGTPPGPGHAEAGFSGDSHQGTELLLVLRKRKFATLDMG